MKPFAHDYAQGKIPLVFTGGNKGFGLVESVVFAVANAIGFGLALTIFAGLREHLDLVNVPKGMKGVPIAFVVAGLLAMAFMGFTGIA